MKIAPHIDRFGEIRKMLVDYVLLKKDNALKKAFLKASREKYGDLKFCLERDFDSLMDEFKPSFKGKRIYLHILPMSNKFVEAMKSEPDPKKGNGKKVRRNDPCPSGSGKKYKECCGGEKA